MRGANTSLMAAAIVGTGWIIGCADSPNVERLYGSGGEGGMDTPIAGSIGLPESGSGGADTGGARSTAGAPTAGSAPAEAGSPSVPQGGVAGSVPTSGSGGVPDPAGGSWGEGGSDEPVAGTTAQNIAGQSPVGGSAGMGSAGAPSAGMGGTGGSPTSGGNGGQENGGSSGQAGSMGTAGAATTDTNLFQGSGFEGSTPEGWYRRGAATLSLTDEVAHSGTQSLAVTGRRENWHGAEYDVRPLVSPGGTYGVTVWAKLVPGSGTGPLTLTRESLCQGGAVQYTWIKNVPAASDSEWVEIKGSFVVPADCILTKLVVYVESSNVTLSYLIDDVRFEDLTK